ncbi:hypothetical protein MTP02_32490 [Streptomyces albus]|nr:hypothetical protein MTP02_32490 [Streptomyces albus]
MTVSIRTVARMVPWARPRVRSAKVKISFQRRASRWFSSLGREKYGPSAGAVRRRARWKA